MSRTAFHCVGCGTTRPWDELEPVRSDVVGLIVRLCPECVHRVRDNDGAATKASPPNTVAGGLIHSSVSRYWLLS